MTIIIRFYFAFQNDRETLIEKYSGNTVKISGYISDEPQIKDFNQSFIFKTEKIDEDLIETNIKVQIKS